MPYRIAAVQSGRTKGRTEGGTTRRRCASGGGNDARPPSHRFWEIAISTRGWMPSRNDAAVRPLPVSSHLLLIHPYFFVRLRPPPHPLLNHPGSTTMCRLVRIPLLRSRPKKKAELSKGASAAHEEGRSLLSRERSAVRRPVRGSDPLDRIPVGLHGKGYVIVFRFLAGGCTLSCRTIVKPPHR